MTRPTSDTLLIDAMLVDEDFFDRVVEHHPATVKFQRVLNNEQVAQELRLADMARMIDLPVPALLAIAAGDAPGEMPEATAEEPLSCDWIGPAPKAATLDLRPVFEAGIEPLMMILEEVSQLGPDDVLVLEAPFHPLPLRRLLRGRAVETFAREIPGGTWQIALRRVAASAAPAA